jgi:hypothetical protein
MGVAPRAGTTAGTKLALIHAAAEFEGRAAKRADAQNRGVSG